MLVIHEKKNAFSYPSCWVPIIQRSIQNRHSWSPPQRSSPNGVPCPSGRPPCNFLSIQTGDLPSSGQGLLMDRHLLKKLTKTVMYDGYVYSQIVQVGLLGWESTVPWQFHDWRGLFLLGLTFWSSDTLPRKSIENQFFERYKRKHLRERIVKCLYNNKTMLMEYVSICILQQNGHLVAMDQKQ